MRRGFGIQRGKESLCPLYEVFGSTVSPSGLELDLDSLSDSSTISTSLGGARVEGG